MRKIYSFLIVMFLCNLFSYGQAPVITISPVSFNENISAGAQKIVTFTITDNGNRDLKWQFKRDSVEFTKADNANSLLSANQDRITNSVWITRGDYQGIFNIAQEASFQHYFSPVGTEWSSNPTWLSSKSDYSDWNSNVGGDMSTVDTFSMHLINDNKYYDVVFHSWTSSGGGGFSYSRFETIKWIDASTHSGTVPINGNEEVSIFIDATDLTAGVYNAILHIASNDPLKGFVNLPIALTVTGSPDISFDPANIDFGDQSIGGDYIQPIDITNTGSSVLNITGIAASTSFYTVTESNISIQPGKSYKLNVHFSPLGIQTYADNLTLTSNAAGSPTTIGLTGNGVAAPIITVDVASISKELISGNSITQTINIGNTGNNDLLWKIKLHAPPVTFVRPNYVDWTLEQFQDKITPTVSIARQNKMGIFNSVNEPSYIRYTSPTGTQWSLGYSDELSPTDYKDWKYSITDYGYNLPELVNKPMSLFLADNDLYIDIKFTSWTGNGQGGGFSYTRDGAVYWISLSIKSGTTAMTTSQAVDINFDATGMKAGIYTGDIIIKSNDPDQGEIVIPTTLKVTGTPVIDANSSIDFGTVLIGSSKVIALEILNTGSDTLKNITLSSDQAYYTFGAYGNKILPGKSEMVNVIYTPSSAATETGTLTISSNDPVNPTYLVSLTGIGNSPPIISVDQTPITATIAAGTTLDVDVSINNTGVADLEGEVNFTQSNKISFNKVSSSDWLLVANQDHITDKVWITRANREGIFNIKAENDYNSGSSPDGTEWAMGKTIDLTAGDYTSWRDAVSGDPLKMIGHVISMHAIEEDRYFDILFDSWTSGHQEGGGGFSYTRIEVPKWVKMLGSSGTVSAGVPQLITFTLDATALNKGVYTANMHIFSNDIVTPEVVIPVTLTVTGAPVIDASTPVSFNDTPIGGSTTETLTISNTGTDVLTVSGITHSLTVYNINSTGFTVNPGQSVDLEVTFSPTAAQFYSDNLEISSDDALQPVFEVAVSGTGIQPPTIFVSRTSIDTMLYPSSVETFDVVIKNNGTTELNWSLEGETVAFTKALNADWNLLANQDRITDNVWITRKSSQGLFNIAKESGYTSVSPKDTKWAFGTTSSLSPTDYKTWIQAVNSDPQSMIDQDMSLFLVTDKKYYDIMFSGYSGGSTTGGGFAYTRKEVIPGWITFSNNNGTLSAGAEETVTVTLDATGLDGKYSTNLVVKSNDPAHLKTPVHVNLTVGGTLVISPIADIKLNQGFISHDIDIANVFESPGSITISAFSDKIAVVTSSIIGNTLTITEVGLGTALITLRAEDENGLVAYEDFKFTVNAGPVVANPIADLVKNAGFGTFTVDLTNVFTDINGDVITLSASSNNTAVATVAVVGKTLTVTEVAAGSAAITVSASDGFALTPTTDVFNLTVNPGTSVEEVLKQSISLYPNPTSGLLTIKLSNPLKGNVFIRVSSIIGVEVLNQNASGANELIHLNLSSLNKGIYFVQIIEDSKVICTNKIIFQ